MSADELPYSFPVDVIQMPANGRVYTLRADEAVRAAVAAHLELKGVGRLIATITVMPAPGGVEITGRFDADVTQTCVVTLEPLPATLSGDISRRFAAAPRPKPVTKTASKPVGRAPKPEKEAPEGGWIDPDEDVPDPIVDGQIDLGGMLVEELSLALDPYPRKPGASFAGLGGSQSGVESTGSSPFAALATLKPIPRGQGRSRDGAKNRPKARR
jgi:hypothetical protein